MRILRITIISVFFILALIMNCRRPEIKDPSEVLVNGFILKCCDSMDTFEKYLGTGIPNASKSGYKYKNVIIVGFDDDANAKVLSTKDKSVKTYRNISVGDNIDRVTEEFKYIDKTPSSFYIVSFNGIINVPPFPYKTDRSIDIAYKVDSNNIITGIIIVVPNYLDNDAEKSSKQASEYNNSITLPDISLPDISQNASQVPEVTEPAEEDKNQEYLSSQELTVFTDYLNSKESNKFITCEYETPNDIEEDTSDTNYTKVTCIEGTQDSTYVTLYYMTENDDGYWKLLLKKSDDSYLLESNVNLLAQKNREYYDLIISTRDKLKSINDKSFTFYYNSEKELIYVKDIKNASTYYFLDGVCIEITSKSIFDKTTDKACERLGSVLYWIFENVIITDKTEEDAVSDIR